MVNLAGSFGEVFTRCIIIWNVYNHGEGAPIHISEILTRRSGSTVTIKLMRRFGMVCPTQMLLAAWREASAVTIVLDHLKNRVHSRTSCLHCFQLPSAIVGAFHVLLENACAAL